MPRRTRYKPPRCEKCERPIKFLLSVSSGKWRPFEPRDVDGRTHVGAIAYPTEGRRYWRLDDLVAELQARHQYSTAEAFSEAYDMPWYVAHTCPTIPTTTNSDPEPSP